MKMSLAEANFRLTFTEEQLADIEGNLLVIQEGLGDSLQGSVIVAQIRAMSSLRDTREYLRQAIKLTAPAPSLETLLELSIESEREKRQCGEIGSGVLPFRRP